MARLTGLLLALLVGACTPNVSSMPTGQMAGIEVTSEAVAPGESIPVVYTCDGQNISLPLSWSPIPEGTAEIVLIVEDFDAPGGQFTHWLVYGIRPQQTGVEIGAPPAGSKLGMTSFGTLGWGGPCPPKGDPPHEYGVLVLALSQALDLEVGADRDEVDAATEGLLLDFGQLKFTFERK